MGQISSKVRRGSDSSTAPLYDSEQSLLEKTYENFYGSETYANLSSGAAVNALPTNTDVPITPWPRPSTSDRNITRPAPARNLYRVSELIDPHDLLSQQPSDGPYVRPQQISPTSSYSAIPNANKPLPALVQSPSGNILGASEFMSRSDRPLAMRERQESIRWALEQAQKEVHMCEGESRKPSWPSSYRKRSKDRQASGSSSGSGSFSGSLRSKDESYGPTPRYPLGPNTQASYYNGGSKSTVRLGAFENAKIEEGRRAYEGRAVAEEERSFGCFNFFRH